MQTIVSLKNVVWWERVPSSPASWCAVEVADNDYSIIRVLQDPGFDDVQYFISLSWIGSRELVEIDNNEFAATLGCGRQSQGPTANDRVEARSTSYVSPQVKRQGRGGGEVVGVQSREGGEVVVPAR